MRYIWGKMRVLVDGCLLGLIVAVSSGCFCKAYGTLGLLAKPYATDSPVISIAAADINGNGEDEIITGTVDNSIYVLNLKGEILWKKNVTGLPLTIAIGDIDNDGKKEIAIAVQDIQGCISVVDCKGNIIWTYKSDFTFLCLDMGDVDADGKDEVVAGDVLGSIHLIDSNGKLQWKKDVAGRFVSCVDIGDINNDQKSEIVIGMHHGGDIVALDGVGNMIWRVSSGLREMRKYPSRRRRWIRSVIVDDINLDGKPDILTSSRPNGMISVFDGRSKPIWQKTFRKIINYVSPSRIGVGNLTGDSRKEIVALLQGIMLKGQKGTSPIYVLDHEGRMISNYEVQANFYNLCVRDVDRDGMSEILTSSSTRGRHFYVLDGHESNRSKLDGVAAAQRDEIDGLIENVRGSKPEKPLGGEVSQIHVLYGCPVGSPHMEEIYRFLSSLGAKNLVFELLIDGLREKTSLANVYRWFRRGRYRSQTEILEMMQFLEGKKIPFFLLVGTHCQLHISLKTLEKILQVAPTACKGFVVHEDGYNNKDWNAFVNNVEKMMMLCKRYGKKKVILNEFVDFWYRVPLFSDVYPRLFRSEFRDILIPMYKSNTPVKPELGIGTILGLWKAGKVKEWGFSTQEDAWHWESIAMIAPDDVLLRMEVMAASLGATYFRIEQNKEFLEIKNGNISLSKGAERHRDLFHHLIRKNIIRPVGSSSQVMLSPVAFKHAPPSDWNRPKGFRQYKRYLYVYGNNNRTFGYQFPLQRVAENYVPGYIYDLRYYAEAIFPKTRYGFFQVVPYWIEKESLKDIRKFWVTDGRFIFEGTRKLDGLEAKKKIIASFRELAEPMPFGADGVFLSVQKFSNDYLIYLLDPGCLDISGVDTVVTVNGSIKNFTILDAISKEKLSVNKRSVALRVPAGGFRILRVVLGNEAQH